MKRNVGSYLTVNSKQYDELESLFKTYSEAKRLNDLKALEECKQHKLYVVMKAII